MNLLRENRKKIKRNLQKKAHSIARLVLVFIFVFGTFAHFIPNPIIAAPPSTGTGDGTYDFSGTFGQVNSGGLGFKTIGDKFVVSNDVLNDWPSGYPGTGVGMYHPSIVSKAEETIIIKAENGTVCKTFTFKDLGLSSMHDLNHLSIQVVLKNVNGDDIATLSNYENPKPLALELVQLSNFLGNGSAYNYQNVASVNITFKYTELPEGANTQDHWYLPNSLNIENITIADVISNTVNTAPTATGVSVNGTLEVGNALTGNYTYNDADNDIQGTSTFKWYRSDDATGTNKAPISGATSKTYILTSADKGKYISFEVTPIAIAGTTTGTPVESSPRVGPIANPNIAPTATGVSVDGAHEVGSILTGKYTYYDEHDTEGTSTFKWYRSDDDAGANKTQISGATSKTYTLTSADTNKYISFEVTPIASAGVTTGSPVESVLYGPIIQSNRAPVLNNINPSLPATNEDTESSEMIVSSFLDSSDLDSSALKGIAVTSITGNGKWQYFDTTWKDISTVSNSSALLLKDTDKIKYIPDLKNGETATLTFRAWDQTSGSAYSKVNATTNGGATAFSTAVGTASLIVTDVNDAPKLTSSAYTFSSIAKNTTSSEVAVSSIATMTDDDNGALSGIAIYQTTGNGTWEYSPNSTTWQGFGTVSGSSALLLRDTDKVRYKSSNLGEKASFSFRGWDQSSGTQGLKVDTTTNGGTTPFSNNTQTASIVVQKSSEANILTFSIPEQLKPATIGAGTIYVEVAGNQNVSSLIPTFTASDHVQSVKVGTTVQVSGTTANDFSNQVTYVVTAEDETTKNWVVTVNHVTTDIALSNNTIAEKIAVGSQVGTLSGTDQDSDAVLSYAIQSGDTAAFAIDNNALKTKAILDYNTKKQYNLTIRVTDQHGAYFDKDFTIDVLDKTPPTATVTMTSSNANDTTKAKVGDTITLDIVANEDIDAPTVTIAGKTATVTKKTDAKTWQATYVMQTGDTEGSISLTLDFNDVNGNQATQVTTVTTGTAVTLDKTAPTVSTVTIKSNYADSTKAKIGDTVTLTITTDEDVQQPVVTIAGNAATVTQMTDAKSWEAEYTIKSGDPKGTVAFTIDMKDIVGNASTQVNATTDNSSVKVLSTNAKLSKIHLSKGSLVPAFDPAKTSYTANVENKVAELEVTLTVEDASATMTLNNLNTANDAVTRVPLTVGSNTISIVVTAEDGETNTYTVTVTRAATSTGGGYTPTPQPEPEIIPVVVEAGDSSVLIPIKRTTDANGNKKDEIALSPKVATEVVQKLKEAGVDTARIVISDAKDEVFEINLSVNKEAIQAIQAGNINLEIYTENARIVVPKDSINEIKEDLYFRVVPIKDEQQKNEVVERAKQEEVVRKVAGTLNIHVLGRPMTIETNMSNHPVDIILPLKGVTIPGDAEEREEFFNKLGVYIEHSDGEKVFIQGELVPYKDGELGLKFTVSKFSTFTIIGMEQGWQQEAPNFNDQYTGRTTEMELPVMVDKVWNITFTQALKPNIINENTVYLYDKDGEKVEITIELSNNNRTIVVRPKSLYKPDTTYYLYVSENIESSNGNQLKGSERYVFKTVSYSLGIGKWEEKFNVSPTKEWKITFSTNVNEALLTEDHIYVIDQHGTKVEVEIEMVNPKTVQITPVKPYKDGQTYYLFIKDLESDQNMPMKDQVWMKFTVVK